MRILTIGNFGFGWDGSICDEEHIAQALEELGHEVHRYQREEAWTNISGNPVYDFTLIAQWDGYSQELLEMLPRPLVYWAFDYQNDGQEWHDALINQADLYLSKRIADSKYDNWQWLSQDFAPMFLHKHKIYDNAEPLDVLFTGSYLSWATERNKTLQAVDMAFNLTIHSVNEWPGFKDVRPPIMDDSLPFLYARARVILSIDHTLEAGYWSDRNAQIMACGRKPLFRYVPLSENTFHNHVEYFYNIEDCLEKVAAGVKDDEASYVYAQNNLKVINRVEDLITIVKGIL